MASGNRIGYGSWELDKGDVNLDYYDFGLGLKIPWHQQRQEQQQNSSISWLQTRQSDSNNSRSPNPAISGFPRFGGDGGRVTFTAGQRQELERQTIIYKYMMNSMPVPPELLIPPPKFPPSSSPVSGRKTGLELRYSLSRGGGDPEPWRCRRTDGKKWRCSRDVAPDQKYCERHSHKGRPSRSRKPVESSPLSTLSIATTTIPVSSNPVLFSPYSLPSPQFNSIPRYPDWFMKKEVAPTAVTATACLYPQIGRGGGGENEIIRTPAVIVEDHHNQNCLLSRPFIDAWSLGDHVDPKDAITNKCQTPSSSLSSILPLTLSMSPGVDQNSDDNANKDLPEIRLSSFSSSHHQQLNWMNSWNGSPPGGPLAEALCLGISGSGNGMMGSQSEELMSPHGHSTSSSTTTLG